jgi:hypothetical protein
MLIYDFQRVWNPLIKNALTCHVFVCKSQTKQWGGTVHRMVVPQGGDMVAEEEVPLGEDMEDEGTRIQEASWSATFH